MGLSNQSNDVGMTKFFCRSATASELEILTKMGQEAFGMFSNLTWTERRAFFKRLLKRNEKVFYIFHNSRQEAVGYFCIIPLNFDLSEAHYFGQKSQFEIDDAAICGDGEQTNLIYLQGLYIRSEYRGNHELLVIIKQEANKRIKQLSKSHDNITLYAEMFTKEGENLLAGLGLKWNGRLSKFKFKIFEKTFQN